MKILTALFLSFLLAACSDGVYWSDGNYTVYKCCGQDFYALGYEINGNGWEGLIDHVTTVGSNSDYVVIKSKGEKYYVVEKVTNNEHWRNRELISLTLSEPEFIKLKVTLGLPEFSQQFE